MKVLNIGSGERFMVKALNVELNVHYADIPFGVRNEFKWLGKDKIRHSGFGLAFFSYSLRYNGGQMKRMVKHLKEIMTPEAIIEIIDYLENPYTGRNVSLETYKRTFIRPFQDAGFKIVDSMVGDEGRVFFRLCTCSKKGVQY
jgi:hypothetical protein